jgi:hypothetical protein
MRIVFTTVLLALSAVATALSVSALPFYESKSHEFKPLVLITVGLWLLFALSLVLCAA